MLTAHDPMTGGDRRTINDPITEGLEIVGMFSTQSGHRPDCEREKTSGSEAKPAVSTVQSPPSFRWSSLFAALPVPLIKPIDLETNVDVRMKSRHPNFLVHTCSPNAERMFRRLGSTATSRRTIFTSNWQATRSITSDEALGSFGL